MRCRKRKRTFEVLKKTTVLLKWFLFYEADRSELLPVQFSSAVSQTNRSLLWCYVPLRFCHHLIAHQKLAHSRAPQQWWVEMNVKMTGFNFFIRSLKRCLVKSHA